MTYSTFVVYMRNRIIVECIEIFQTLLLKKALLHSTQRCSATHCTSIFGTLWCRFVRKPCENELSYSFMYISKSLTLFSVHARQPKYDYYKAIYKQAPQLMLTFAIFVAFQPIASLARTCVWSLIVGAYLRTWLELTLVNIYSWKKKDNRYIYLYTYTHTCFHHLPNGMIMTPNVMIQK